MDLGSATRPLFLEPVRFAQDFDPLLHAWAAQVGTRAFRSALSLLAVTVQRFDVGPQGYRVCEVLYSALQPHVAVPAFCGPGLAIMAIHPIRSLHNHFERG